MKELHALVDFENVKPTLEQLAKLAPGFTDVWVFHGPNERKKAEQIKLADSRVTLVPHPGKGKNALDFHLSFYLGYVAARHPGAHLVVVANDRGYDPMLAHARLLKFTVKRVGYKPEPAAKKVATPAAAKAAPADKPTPAQKVARAKVSAPAQKQEAKNAPTEKAVASKMPVKKAATSNPAAAKATVPSKASAPALTAEERAFARIKKALSKMGKERPNKTKSFLRHIGALIGQGGNAEQIDAVVAKLEKDGAVRISGDAVEYL